MRDRTDRPHDEAMAELFRDDPEFAAYALCDVLADGDELDLALLLPQLEETFSAVWARVPDLSSRLRKFCSGSDQLHWTPSMADGWYCVPAGNGFNVYHQARGLQERFIQFSSEKDAMQFVLKAAFPKR
ncbi:hypothetical protein HUX88_22150 [Duganella sp. BJB1802]|uniref:hypothetical protein n=1 Tax=Duganella sp. BJB1802 TaxID=2744575 RepID=UPI001594DD0C|nr:hypothetical protein [Duganella sp. BJB1802]NVD73222.1 hypothetical protein [Duganella sp. BJB1802]